MKKKNPASWGSWHLWVEFETGLNRNPDVAALNDHIEGSLLSRQKLGTTTNVHLRSCSFYAWFKKGDSWALAEVCALLSATVVCLLFLHIMYRTPLSRRKRINGRVNCACHFESLTVRRCRNIPRQRWVWQPDGLSQWEFWVGGFADIYTLSCAQTMLVSAGEGHISTNWHTQKRTHFHVHAHRLYLAGDVAVASCLALGTPQQGLPSGQKRRGED